MKYTLSRMSGVTKVRGRSRAKSYNDINDGLLTPGIKISEGATAWPNYEIDALNAAEIAGWSHDEIRKLVVKLVEFRDVVSTKPTGDIENLLANLMATIREVA